MVTLGPVAGAEKVEPGDAAVLAGVGVRLLFNGEPAGAKPLRSQPKAANHITHHWYPLQPDDKSAESKQIDVTFRLALIAKSLGWELTFV